MWTTFVPLVVLLCTSSLPVAVATYKASALFASYRCRGPPDIILLESGGSCVDAECSGRVSTVCSIENADKYFANTFGNANQYIYIRSYFDSRCTDEKEVGGMRVYQDNCIQADAGSVSISVSDDGSVKVQSYTTSDCTGTPTVGEVASSDVGLSTRGEVTKPASCIRRSKLYLSQPYTNSVYKVVTYFTDSKCTVPNRIATSPASAGEVVQAVTCTRDTNGAYYSRDKNLVSDMFAYAKKTLGAQTTYVLQEKMDNNNPCVELLGWDVYRAEGECIDMSEGTTTASRKVSIDTTGSVVIRSYNSSATCSGDSTDLTVQKRGLNGQTCPEFGRFYVHTPEPTTNMRQSSSNVIALSIAAIATLVATVAASVFMA